MNFSVAFPLCRAYHVAMCQGTPWGEAPAKVRYRDFVWGYNKSHMDPGRPEKITEEERAHNWKDRYVFAR